MTKLDVQQRQREPKEELGEAEIPQLGGWYWVGPSFPQDTSPRGIHQWMPDDFYGSGPENLEDFGPEVEVPSRALEGNGRWTNHEYDGPWLGCVVARGTNYVELDAPFGRGPVRVHHVNLDARLQFEPNASTILRERAAEAEEEVRSLVQELRELCEAGIPSPETGLARLAESPSPEVAKAALETAKNNLPILHQRLHDATQRWKTWLTASMLELEAAVVPQHEAVKEIKTKIFNISLYAGLEEQVVTLREGDPAPYATPIHVHQRRLYMDEECLARYRAGGMNFKDIHHFDEWLLEHVDDLLPHPRCVVSFRVRRHLRRWDYERAGDPSASELIRFWYEAEQDRATYLYLRNGEQVYRLDTQIEFGETMFPDDAGAVYSEEQLTSSHGGNLKSRREWEVEGRPRGWHPWTPDNPHYDDVAKRMASDAMKHNRIALVIQGLLDRSSVFQPHPKAQLWTPGGFAKMIRLVFDDSLALVPADLPNFKEFQQRCNAELKVGSLIVGQRAAWAQHMRDEYGYSRDWPAAAKLDPGPPSVARVEELRPRKRSVVLRWERPTSWASQQRPGSRKTTTTVRLEVSFDDLLNVSAYKAGDFRLFYADPRTRERYLEWAPLLLLAEEAKKLAGQNCAGRIFWRVNNPRFTAGDKQVCFCGMLLTTQARRILYDDQGEEVGLGEEWDPSSTPPPTPLRVTSTPLRFTSGDEDEDEDVPASRLEWAICTPPHPRWGVLPDDEG